MLLAQATRRIAHMTPALTNGAHTSATPLVGRQVVLVSAARTPVGSFNGGLKKLTAPQLGVVAVKAAIERAGIKPDQVEDIYMGNVLQAGVGQSPARQVAIGVGCPESTEATTINKVCASGMKAIMLASQNIQTGQRDIMVAGGMESMSNSPFYFPRNAAFGHQSAQDAIVKDGLWDVYGSIHMGSCTEELASKKSITREDQDNYAIESYRRAAEAWKSGAFDAEIAPVEIPDKKAPITVREDEDYKKVQPDKMKSLRGAFKPNGGTVTAANASNLNDGASAVVLMSEEKAQELGLKPLAKIISMADAACAPVDFGIAPSLSTPIALKRAGLSVSDIARFEFNEAFSAVAIANREILGLDASKLNVLGGAVALGHPIGSSGSRIVVTLAHQLKAGEYGLAAICNGGGGSSAIIIQRL
ncbi:uncharacterized protein L969DRAFT_55356 [Mixia osmundae IAM 14324]|uniref:acetyl-CoA C-acetyltransferase n=1 Tax=Mixia osmundae (strain CBS 9802 / IAM 14324 / JCM 22182 / KY 12970) TaxID=764103 RepID=G7E4D3_MIXOS|nr:uncharacterized protein L969DRAFT_55356 [Mixia osmundae IAM 14324]KEI36290.1 hypothetical protein L969DRAFT_55356 [Mixia osmundae IAM 14324]GAA97693.1 hypothetical protein E5Q_04371 [Mixia osmundae IAM 14324]